ncbi:eEF1A lysine and N-terminal methyltransferase isoform X1 [Microcaecilia unicolor]|uniref:eEF1A lysine and N-terminal methyltransferase n=1 Tax=Microcaecilia unicolor TaxID=1415580 RepID=A0A6P7YDV9_9AMPH|nr:eEF1A lysine and N-terminal methyltransferase isoform X1 [Microcaecilia unicolor]
MDLLPRSCRDFGSVQYWEGFFRKRGKRTFEWYGALPELGGVLQRYLRPKDKVLVVGCGNSELSEQLYDVGYQHLVNIDLSEMVIRQMTERNVTRRPTMSFFRMDALQMEFPDAYFQVVLDKGTLDAILTDTEAATLQRADSMFAEIGRVLQVGGRFLCVSLAQDHVLRQAVDYFTKEGWMVRVHQITEREGGAEERRFPMPIFVFVMTKCRKMADSALQILEICVEEQGQPLRVESKERLVEAVKERQQYALLRNQLKTGLGVEGLSLDLCKAGSEKPRYTLCVVDSSSLRPAHANHFAIFIVPQGRETEWLFRTEEGRKQLAGSAGFRRLIVVTLHRDHQYDGMEGIQSELSAKVLELGPPGMPANQQIPFLSAGGDIGVRKVQQRGCSNLSGEYVIEDVKGEGENYFRRLIFLSNRNVVQSEARLLPPAPSKGQKRRKREKKQKQRAAPSDSLLTGHPAAVDKSYLCCEHHKAMIAGLSLLRSPQLVPACKITVLVVGLGGGSLPLFIHDYLPQSYLHTVEIDSCMVEVARQWFGFTPDERMEVYIADGLEYISQHAEKGDARYDVIMFDVDSKDPSLGISCPPPAFVEKLFLQKVRNILMPEGIFVLNLVCRDPALKEQVLAVLREFFPLVYVRKIEDEVNEILFCQNFTEPKRTRAELLEQAQTLQNQLEKPGQPWDSTYLLSDMLKSLQVV